MRVVAAVAVVLGLVAPAAAWAPVTALAAPAPVARTASHPPVSQTAIAASQPTGVAVDGAGHLYIAGGNQVTVASTSGGTPTLLANLVGAHDVALDRSGNLYVSDPADTQAVIKFAPAVGSPHTVLPTPDPSPYGVAVNAAGDLFAAGNSSSVISRFTSGVGWSTFVSTGLSHPNGLAVDRAGNVYIVDGGHNLVVKVPAAGGSAVTLPFTGLSSPDGVAVDSTGNVFVSDTGNNRVVELPVGGGALVALPFTGLSAPMGVAVDDAGNVYVADKGNNRVAVLPGSGGTQANQGTNLGSPPGGLAVDGSGHVFAAVPALNQVVQLSGVGGGVVTVPFNGVGPQGVALDSQGNVYVADTGNNRVVRLLAGGGAQSTLAFTGLNNPYGVATNAAGDVFVADTGNNRVVKLPAGGGAQQVLAFTGLSFPVAVAVDATGAVYATDTFDHQVLTLPAGGGAQAVVPTVGLGLPYGLAVDTANNLYIADASNNRVLEVPPGGGAQAVLGFTGLDGPVGVAVSRSNTVYVGDQGNRVIALTRTPPQLRVITQPALPADIVVDGTTRDTWGLNWPTLVSGTHEVCFSDVPGYTTPACSTVTMALGSTSTVEGAYVAKGYVRAITDPPVPSTISVDGVPRNDWGLWTEIDPGAHQVCFGSVKGFATPSCRVVNVVGGDTATTTGSFAADPSAPGPGAGYGYLRVTTDPPAGAAIIVDGQVRNTWGLDWLKLPAGSPTVCFGPVPGLTLLSGCQIADINEGQTTTIQATYTPKGSLRVVTSPAVWANITINGEVANAWGAWPTLAPGSYKVCFGPAGGYVAPACQTAVVVGGSTTTVTGAYVPS